LPTQSLEDAGAQPLGEVGKVEADTLHQVVTAVILALPNNAMPCNAARSEKQKDKAK
jgi:hypothetical protein